MKKILAVFVLMVGALILFGCEKTNPLVGSWTHSAGYTYTFNKDKTGSYAYGETEMKFTYEDDGKKVSIKYENSDNTLDLEYKIDGKTLTIKDSFGSDVEYTRK